MLVTVPRGSRSCEQFADGLDIHLLLSWHMIGRQLAEDRAALGKIGRQLAQDKAALGRIGWPLVQDRAAFGRIGWQ